MHAEEEIELSEARLETSLAVDLPEVERRERVVSKARAEHVAFARRFGELEDHPVVGSDPDHPGLVRIHKGPDSRNEQYENAYHCDTTWREHPQFGAVLRWMGGIPVDRSRPHGMVDDSVAAFSKMERRVLAIAPQGTRRPVPHFKTGFLHIARGAQVPVMLAALVTFFALIIIMVASSPF